MGDKYILNLTGGMGLTVHTGNHSIQILGEDVEAPYVNITGTEAIDVSKDFVSIQEENRLMLRIRPELEMEGGRTYKFHIPAGWEQDLQLEVNEGQVRVENITGVMDIQVIHGNIELKSVNAEMKVICNSGGIQGFNMDGRLNLSISRGNISLKECRPIGGTIKSGNGNLDLQLVPSVGGPVSIQAGNGDINLAVPQGGDFKISVQAKEKAENHLEGCTVSQEGELTTYQQGSGQYIVKISSFNGKVILMKWEDAGRDWKKQEGFGFENFKIPDPSKFFQDLFGGGVNTENKGKNMDITDFLKGFVDLNTKFEKFGEDVMKKFKEMQNPGSRDDEVKIVLDMVKEGKISTEDAERLINAMKKK